MATVTLKGSAIETCGDLPAVGSAAPDFTLVGQDLSESSLSAFSGHRVILNVFPSIDTDTCKMSVRKFNEAVSSLDNTVVLCISADLPFAQARFCGAEGIKNVTTLSTFRSPDFGQHYGLTFASGPLKGLLARAVVVVDQGGKVAYTELVSEVVDEPNYDAAIASL